MSAANAVEALLVQFRDWWQSRGSLAGIAAHDLERIANDLGMSAADLEDMMTRGPQAADFLHERMRALGLSRADVERNAVGLMSDLERTCAHCSAKGACEKDLVSDPAKPDWKGYCPNVVSLESLARLKQQH